MAIKYTEEQLNTVDKSLIIQMFLNQQEELSKAVNQIEQLTKEVQSGNDKLQRMMEQIILSNNARFGRSSEKMDNTDQISFMEVDGNIIFFNESEAVCDLSAEEPEDLEPKPRGKKKVGKKEADMSGLPVNRVNHYMTEEELIAEFGENGWKQLPDAISKRYKFIPAKVIVTEHHVGVYASKKDNRIVKADHPKALLKGSPVSASIAAAIMNGKYVNAFPLYRLEKEFERYGLAITRQNMANWMIRLGETYISVMYDYQLTRNASHPREFLKDFSGICVTDGYQVYHTLEKEKEDLTIAGCWVHMRRRFEQALQVIPKGSQKGTVSYIAMKQIQAIYREEGKLKDLTSNERLEQRQAIIKPLVDALFMYLKQNQANVSGSCKLQDAFKYALNQEKYLKVFLTDGDVPIDNNASERAIRGFCVGKKNWQMIDTINGARTSAMIYSIAETAKANNLKPYDYFEYLLEEIPKHMEDTDRSFLEDLLPWSENLPAHIRK